MKRTRISVGKRVYAWLPIAIGITFVFGILYILVNQIIRQGANDPQIQMAQDAAHDLSEGMPPREVIPAKNIDIRESLAPFMIVYDDAGRVLASSAELDGKTPVLPPGVFDYTREHVEDRIPGAPGIDGYFVMRFTDGTRLSLQGSL
jgi:hypothetical protein